MRKVSMAALVGMLLAAHGCTLTIPSGLLKPGGGTTIAGGDDCRALFFKYDLNGDQQLTEDEYVRGRMGTATTDRPANAGDRKLFGLEDDFKAGFKAMDKDGNGRVTQEEFLAACEGVTKSGEGVTGTGVVGPGVIAPGGDCKTSFKQFDRDGNGMLSREEYQQWVGAQPVPMMARACPPVMPVDESGLVVRNEADANRPLPPCDPAIGPNLPPFEKVDANGDGEIDPGEFCQLQGPTPPVPVATPTPGQPSGPGCEETFKRADANQDGVIDLSEYRAADYRPPLPPGMAGATVMPSPQELEARFKRLDANGDGKLDPKEFCQNWGSVGPTPQPGDECRVGFDRLDPDRDGRVSWDEFFMPNQLSANMPAADYDRRKAELHTKFQTLDRNQDGFIDPAEYCGAPAPVQTLGCEGDFKAFDKDASGFVTYDEYAAGRFGQLRFIQAPTQEEAAKLIDDFKARAKALDVNGDEKLSLDEFRRSCY